MYEKPFIDACLSGDAHLNDIDAYIEYWHTHNTGNLLPEFLGMTPDEYEEWLRSGEDTVLRNILAARKVSAEALPITNEDLPYVGMVNYTVVDHMTCDKDGNDTGWEYVVAKMTYKESRVGNDIDRYWDEGKFLFRSEDYRVANKMANLLNSGELSADKKIKDTLVVNAFAGPGAGKTTSAFNLVAELKKRGIIAEYISEYAKELVWEKNFELLDGSIENEKKIYNEKKHRIERLIGKVDVIVTDSSLIQSVLFLNPDKCSEQEINEFSLMALSDTSDYNNFNYFVERGDSYETEGRIHTVDQAKYIDTNIKQYLLQHEISFETVSQKDISSIAPKVAALCDQGNPYNRIRRPFPRQRLFVDMDGTIAVFTPVDQLEKLYEKGWFEGAAPIENVLEAVKQIIRDNPDIEVNILSAYLSDSKFALEEKNRWLNRYLPEIDPAHRIFVPCGDDKKDYIPDGLRTTDVLLDDYTHNLMLWQPPARGIKLLNGINHSHGTWTSDKIRFDKSPGEIANNIISIMRGQEHVYDMNRADAGQSCIIGVVSWNHGISRAYTDANKYISMIKDEIDFRASSGFSFVTTTNDPEICKAVDGIVYGVYSEDSPHDAEPYSHLKAANPEATQLQNFFSDLCLNHGLDKEVVREAFDRQAFSDKYGEDSESFCLYGRDDVESVAVFSNLVDALSHASLDMVSSGDFKSIDRIALGKDPFPSLAEYLETNPGVKNIVICTSVDKAGNERAWKLKDDLLKAGYTLENGYHCQRHIPTGCKDFNGYLLAYKAVVQGQRTEDREKETAAEKEDGFFPEADPEDGHEM